jgi:hypothetical protein
MFDGHPDNSLSHPHFSDRLVLGTSRFGGGFKNFRPFTYASGRILREPNAHIRDFGGDVQFDRTRYAEAGQASTFHTWVRARLATVPVTVAMRTVTPVSRCDANCAADRLARRRRRTTSTHREQLHVRRRPTTVPATVSPS